MASTLSLNFAFFQSLDDAPLAGGGFHVASMISPSSESALTIASRILNEDDYEGFRAIFSKTLDQKDSLELLKTLNYSLQIVKSPHVTKRHLEELFKKLNLKLESVQLCGIPVIHRLYFHIYDIARMNNQFTGGDNWGEIHAFENKDRLCSALERLILELGDSQVSKLTTSALDALNLAHRDYSHKSSFARFCHIFDESYDTLECAIEKLDISSPRRQDRIVRQLTSHARLAAPLISKHRPITWLTGTNSYTLIGMHAAKLKGLSSNFSLIPSGVLLSHNVVPLAGELGGGIEKRGINLTRLSGCSAEEYKNAFGYAKNKSYFFDKKKLASSLLEKCRSFRIDAELLSNPCAFHPLKIELLRALQFLSLSSSLIQESKQILISKLEDLDASYDLKENFRSELDQVFEEKAIELPQELEVLFAKPTYPLVFATNIPEYNFKAAHSSSIRGETTYAGSLALGEQIQFAITDDENVEEVASILKDHTMCVISFKVAEIFLKYHFSDAVLRHLENF